MKAHIGFIGLGRMGRWMALNMLRAGYPMTVFDVDEAAASGLGEQGASISSSPRAAAEASDFVFLCLPGAQAVEEVVFGEEGVRSGARPGLVVVDLGTSDYLRTVEFSAGLAQSGIHLVDAPVTGMESRAEDGTLTVMCGGDAGIFQSVKPILETVGRDVLYMGRAGSGQLAKLTNQLLFNTNLAALAEILPMAVKLGLDPEKITQVINTGTGRSFASEFFLPGILEGRFDRGYHLEEAYKDMAGGAGISAREKIPLPVFHAALTTYQTALAQGLGREDKGAMIKVFERINGVEFRSGGKDRG